MTIFMRIEHSRTWNIWNEIDKSKGRLYMSFGISRKRLVSWMNLQKNKEIKYTIETSVIIQKLQRMMQVAPIDDDSASSSITHPTHDKTTNHTGIRERSSRKILKNRPLELIMLFHFWFSQIPKRPVYPCVIMLFQFRFQILQIDSFPPSVIVRAYSFPPSVRDFKYCR
jgi:hypothetical protein